MKNTKEAFYWIVDILRMKNIPFHIAGGLAAKVYGAKRKLADIDIDVPDEMFERISSNVKDYIIYGPKQYKDDSWDLLLMTLNYKGQEIDIAGAYKAKLFNREKGEWELAKTDFSKDEQHTIFGFMVSVINKKELIEYKSKLKREVDIQDISEITNVL